MNSARSRPFVIVVLLVGLGLAAASVPSRAKEPTTGAPVPLFSSKTKLEPATIEDTPEAIITRVGDRVRDRHAREGKFHAYDHYLPLYWENRTVAIEIIDRVAKGGDSITYNMTSLAPLNSPNLRLFFEGKGTVAQYTNNLISKQVDPLHYTVTIKVNTNERRPLKTGDRIEMEFSPFLKPPVAGRTNYYGTALLYVVGTGGFAPWEGRGDKLDSFPMPDEALLGGATTSHRQYSDEPKEPFKQMATNIAPTNAQPFVLGRRLHHSDFGTGMHSERGNPVYPELVDKLGRHFVGRSCVACHTNNGRALPANVGAPMTSYLVRVGSDAKGTPHPKLGSALQSQTAKGSEAEAGVTISGWETIEGTYGDGTAFTLRKPTYKFTGVVPDFFSVRVAPPLVGQGLLEALDEGDLGAKPKTGRVRTVTDPETGDARVGRFGWKAGQARLKHQIAGALNNDMGVTTSIYPKLDQGSEQGDRGAVTKLSDADLENMYRYVAVLGVPPRRDLDDADAKRGEKLFADANCVQCHTPKMKTSAFHPLAELRNQTVRPYTDLRLHDMGAGLADNMAEGTATGAEWRTTPLGGREVGLVFPSFVGSAW